MTRKVKKGLFKRKINGKNYYGGPWYDTKKEAKEHAERSRKHGHNAVLIPATYNDRKGYRVLTRRK